MALLSPQRSRQPPAVSASPLSASPGAASDSLFEDDCAGLEDGKPRGRFGKVGRPKGKVKASPKPGDSVKQTTTIRNNIKLVGKDKKSKTHFRWCRACRKWYTNEGMALAGNSCIADKRALDSIYYWSKVQNRLEWYARMRDSEEKIFVAVTEFHDRFPSDFEQTGVKRARQSRDVTSTFLEQVICATKVTHRTEGELMWLKEFVDFAQSYKGGKMTDDQARSQWQKWVQQLEEEGEACELLHDYKGPASAPMRFWVKTSDKILFDEVFEKQKIARVEEKSVKKATQDDIDSMQRKLQTNHENIGRSSVVQDMSVAAKNMLAVKGEDPARSAFEGNNMEIPNISKLAESESEGDAAVDDVDKDDGLGAGAAAEGEQEEDEEEQGDVQEDKFEVEVKQYEKFRKKLTKSFRFAKVGLDKLYDVVLPRVEEMNKIENELTQKPELAGTCSDELKIIRLFFSISHNCFCDNR